MRKYILEIETRGFEAYAGEYPTLSKTRKIINAIRTLKPDIKYKLIRVSNWTQKYTKILK